MSKSRLQLMVPKQLRELPADLTAVLLLVGLTNLVVLAPWVNESPVRVVVGLAFVLFVPGYAFVAALFPEAGSPPSGDATESGAEMPPEASPKTDVQAASDRGIDGIERIALSFGLSIAIVPLIGLALNFTPFGIRLLPILVSVSGFTVIATALAGHRRLALPESDRFRVPYWRWLADGRRELLEPASRLDAFLNVALVLALLLATSSVVYAVAVPPQGEQFTEFYLLTEDDDGELVADGYPATLTPGEEATLHVGLDNNEHESVSYTTVVQLERVEGDGNETRVTDRVEVDRWTSTLSHNETRIAPRTISVTNQLTGENLRLTFLLYRDNVPSTPTRETAYRELHLWVTVAAE